MGSGVNLRVLAPGRRPPLPRRWGRTPSPLVIAHRGASAHALENTLEAFRRAREHGADGVELDARRCATGEVVVFHDDDLERLAGRPERVEDLPLAAVREVRLRVGGAIPTLAEVLEELGPDLLVNVELKAGRPCGIGALARAAIDVVRRHGAVGRVLVSSFHPLAVAACRLAAPELATGLIFAGNQALPLRRAWSRHLLLPAALHPERRLATRATVARWHAEGHAVNVWTVDEAGEVERLAALGVDGIITNDPARTRGFLVR